MSLASSDDARPERRGAERIRAQHVRLIYATRGLLSFLHRRRQGHLIDVSRSGARFLTDEELQVGQRLSIALRLRHEDPAIRFDAEVVWIERDEKRGACSVAIRCIGYRDESWHRLWEFIDASTKDAKRQEQEERDSSRQGSSSNAGGAAAPPRKAP